MVCERQGEIMNTIKTTKLEFNELEKADNCLLVYEHKVNRVSRKLWNKCNGTSFHKYGMSIKYFGIVKEKAIKRVIACRENGCFNKFKKQSSLLDGMSVVVTLLKTLGEFKNSDAFNTLNQLPGKINYVLDNWDVIFCEIISLLDSILSLKVDIMSVVRVCINIYTLAKRNKILFEAQGFDSILMATLLEALPQIGRASCRERV